MVGAFPSGDCSSARGKSGCWPELVDGRGTPGRLTVDLSRRCLVRSESVFAPDDDESSEYRRPDASESLVGAVSANDCGRGPHSRGRHRDRVRGSNLGGGCDCWCGHRSLADDGVVPQAAVLGPTGALPGVISAVLLVRELYPVAAIGGIVSVTGLLWNTRDA